jgi:beta-galactosidase
MSFLKKLSRRTFFTRAGQTAAGTALLPAISGPGAQQEVSCAQTLTQSLDGPWLFRLDPGDEGESQAWYQPQVQATDWAEVKVPHTWQSSEKTSGYMGVAWYRRTFQTPTTRAGETVRIEFEAVYHSATVWVNGHKIGQHLGKGYTAFTLDASPLLSWDELNHLAVKVDNSFDRSMLPRGDSYDWAADGGIIRPARLLITPPVFIARVDVDAQPDLATREASLEVKLVLRNTAPSEVALAAGYWVAEEDSGRIVLRQPNARQCTLKPGAEQELILPPARLPNARLWHFDHPDLYHLVAELGQDGQMVHSFPATFGVRKFEVKDGGFHFNGERVWLMGVERMAGSNPDFGMAEPEAWIRHDHDDLKELNCVFTRVHWQQDRRVLDYCDRHGILIQEEVPTWGADTFKGMSAEPDPAIMQNGLEQLREMISRDRNHPSIVAWGLCNEIGGQNPPAYQFARRMFEEAGKLDPHRLRTYASNSLQKTPARDVSGLMDFVEWNEYYETWYPGTVQSVRENLEEIHRAFPDKVIVISEYGYCECTPDRLGGDPSRIRILRQHNEAFREGEEVGGAIFFCYNDYRTHVGDKGTGVLKQRVHGVVDLTGGRKPSFEALRRESSPVEELMITPHGRSLAVTVTTRRRLPAYTLDGYRLRSVVHGFDGLPMEKREVPLPRLEPGRTLTVQMSFQEENPKRVKVDVMRPTGFSALTAYWEPQSDGSKPSEHPDDASGILPGVPRDSDKSLL